MNRKIFAISVIIFALDQISKNIVGIVLDLNESITIIKNFFSITLVHNYGAAWNLFQNRTLLIIIGTIIAIIIIYRYMYSFQMNKRNIIAFGLLTGGIFGNLVDRVLHGYVIDFVSFNIFGFNFPVFNISDMSIVIGVGLLIIAIIKGEDKIDKVNSKKK